MDLRFHHGGVNVPNLEQAITWYREVLGFELERTFEIPPANAKVAIVRNGDLRFEIFCKPDSRPLPDERRMPITDLNTCGNKHVAFQVDDFEATIAELENKNADIAFIVREDFGKGCFIRDCAGNLIEIVEEPRS
ncbi:VOC family protein [Halioxenophilus aromaticivorans]|uniref:VOC domain-containing protein n=1 Tax=Halioxenophilus aromaticivorans TaxID=1306992 RepID=A0AAV3U884_9ALTE